MKTAASFFVWLELVGLGVWVGGMLTLGALVAPTVFDVVRPNEMAGEAMSLVFRKFNAGLVYVCIVLIAIGFLGKWFLGLKRERSRWVEGGMLTVMILSGIYMGAVLSPRLQDLRQIKMSDPSNTAAVVEFNRKHRTSEQLFTVNLLLGLAVLGINSGASAVSDRKEIG